MSELTGADIRELRARRSWSHEDLASIVGGGWSARTLHLIENGLAWSNDELNERLILLGAVPGAGGPVTPAAEPAPVSDELAPPPEPELEPTQAIRRFSNSEIQTFKRCRRKWWLAWHRGLAPRVESPVGPRQVGNRIHRALEITYEVGGPYHDRLLPALEKYIAEDRATVVTLDEVTKKQFEDEANLERIMLQGYLEWLESTGIDANLRVLGAEEYVEAALPPSSFRDTYQMAIYIIGRLDVRVLRQSDGASAFIDHKTIAAFANLAQLLPLNEQSKHYQLLQWLTTPEGQRVSGVIFSYLRRVKRSARANPPFYMREDVEHTRVVMENYYDRLVGEIQTILDAEHALNEGENHHAVAFPTPHNNCTWDCDFFKLCHMFDDGSRVEDALSAQFVVGDPLSYYDRKEKENE